MRHLLIITTITLILFSAFVIKAQDEEKQPQARLRMTFECVRDCENYQPPENKYYSVEILMPVSLRKSEFDNLLNPSTMNKPIIVQLFNKKTLTQYKVEVSRKDNLLLEGKRRRFFVIYLPKTFDVTQNYLLKFKPYSLEDNSEIDFLSASVEIDFQTSFGLDSYNNVFEQKIEFDPNPITCEDDDDDCNDDKSALKNQHLNYVNWRLSSLYKWLKNIPKAQIKLFIEDVNRCLGQDGSGCIKFGSKEYKECKKQAESMPTVEEKLKKFEECSDAYHKSKQLKLEDLDKYGVAKIELSNIKRSDRILIDITPSKHLPSKFNSLLKYDDPNVPLEVAKNSKSFADEIAQVVVNPSKDTGNVGERDIASKLEVGFLLGSSVEEVEKNVNGVATKVKERKTQGVLDLWFKPFGVTTIIAPANSEESKGWYVDWTPAFLDAKVSTGKITEDTLSLNRVVIGTQFDAYYFFKNNNNSTYPRFIGRFLHASDRDFKQGEYKVNFEFQPILSFLNRIPENFSSTQYEVLRKRGDINPIREIIPSRGYQINPFFGFELGRTWFRRRPAESIEPSDAVKRIYVGFDTKFYLSKNITVSLLDKIYFNFGKNIDKKVNYFNGSLDFKVRGNQRFGDSVFISFERGQQPPFDTPSVNAVKIGYRFVNPNFNIFR